MKIWIDARICDEGGYYGDFVCELIEALNSENSEEHEIIVYRKTNLAGNRHSLFSERKTRKIFEKEQFHLMIFFDHHIPAWYTGRYIVLLESLKEVFFPKKRWIQRKIFSHKLKKAIAKSQKVLVLDSGSAMELNENLNIHEDKIAKIPWFFPKYSITKDSPVAIDVKTKHNLRGEYLIYDSGNEMHNNFERILKTLHTLKQKDIHVYLLVLCEETTKDIDIRNKVLEYGISHQVLFLGTLPKDEEHFYYEQSSGVVFSSIYESFPFAFTKALAYNCPIFANDIPAHHSVMWDSIAYLDPLSIHNMCDVMSENIAKPQKINYSSLFKKFHATSSAQELHTLIAEKY